MRNYFNYFTEIEERFQQRRGTLLMLSTVDWALIETWREAGLPVEAVLRGIDDAFDHYEKKPSARKKKINGLAWCSQNVMQAAEAMAEAAIGSSTVAREPVESGFESERIAAYLQANAGVYEGVAQGDAVMMQTAVRLREMAAELLGKDNQASVEDVERTLTVLEEKVFASLKLSASEDEMVRLKEQADRELAPYRARMHAGQMRQVQEQFLQKRLLEARGLPRLSLFYMSHG